MRECPHSSDSWSIIALYICVRWCLGEKRSLIACTVLWLSISWMLLDTQFKYWRALSQKSTLKSHPWGIYSTIGAENLIPKASPVCRYPFREVGSGYAETTQAWMLSKRGFKGPIFATPHFNMFLYPKEYSILMLEWTEIKKKDVSNTPKLLQAFFNLPFLSTSAFSSEKKSCHYLFSAM